MIGTTLIVNAPLTGYAASHVERLSFTPWPGGPRRTFERADVIAVGKLRYYGSFVTRYVVRLVDGAEIQVTGTEQAETDRRWLAKLGRNVPCERRHLPTRENPWTLAWHAVTPPMTRILPGGALAAAIYYTERLDTPGQVAIAEAARLHAVSRQAVHQALAAQGRAPGKRGRRPGAPSGKLTVRRSDAELEAWTAAAGEQPVAAWVRDRANEAARRGR